MTFHRLALGAALALAVPTFAACGGNNSNNDADARVIVEPPDAGIDASGPPADANCITNPTTSEQITNACTDAVKIDKHPTLPLQYSDGGLPPLP
jgi:hypothetical protein